MSFSLPKQLWSKQRALAERLWHSAAIADSRGVPWSLLRATFSVASLFYRWGAQGHQLLYASGMRRACSSPIPVINVGNLSLGGSGKTPFTCLLAEMLALHRRVAIISRGYRSAAERLKRPLVASLGAGPLYPPDVMGDEAFLLASRVPEVICVVGRDRAEAVQMAAEQGAEVAILDDGMQHRKLKAQLNIVLLNASLPPHAWELFPRGALREPLTALKRADLIGIVSQGDSDTSQVEWQAHKHASAPLLYLELCPGQLFDREGAVPVSLQDKPVALLAGIAHPERFEKTIRGLGGRVVSVLSPGDHGSVSPATLARFGAEAKAKGAEALVCTEKDWVKLPSALDLPLPLLYLQISMRLRNGGDILQGLLERGKILLTG